MQRMARLRLCAPQDTRQLYLQPKPLDIYSQELASDRLVGMCSHAQARLQGHAALSSSEQSRGTIDRIDRHIDRRGLSPCPHAGSRNRAFQRAH